MVKWCTRCAHSVLCMSVTHFSATAVEYIAYNIVHGERKTIQNNYMKNNGYAMLNGQNAINNNGTKKNKYSSAKQQ